MTFSPTYILLGIFTLLLGLVVLITVKILYNRWKYRHIPGPPTKGILGFYIGNLVDFMEFNEKFKGKSHADLHLQWAIKYGPVYKYQYLHWISVETIEPALLKEVLVTEDCPKFEGLYRIFARPLGRRFLGAGLFTQMDKTKWRHQRSMFNPGFHRDVLNGCVKDFNAKGDELMKKLRSMADGKTSVDMLSEINHATLDAIALVGFGMMTDTVNDDSDPLNYNVGRVLEACGRLLREPSFIVKPKEWPYIKKFLACNDELRAIGRKVIKERFEKMANNEYIPDDILAAILKNSKDESVNIEDLLDEWMTFFVAGMETTANALSFTIQELGQNPEALAKLREEVDRVVGKKTEISMEMVNQLEYTGAAFKEALRMYPPGPFIFRKTENEMQFNEYKIPSGTFVTIPIYVSGRYPKYWDNPSHFMPERFLKSNETKITNYTYMPFSIGPRNCIGQNFAHIESKIFLAKMIQHFDFKLDPNQVLGHKYFFTMTPCDGALCFLTPRE